jgi:hypothetical protein
VRVVALVAATIAVVAVTAAAGVYLWDRFDTRGVSADKFADEMLAQLDEDLTDQVFDDQGVREADVDVNRVHCVRTNPERAACLVEAEIEGEGRNYRYVVDIGSGGDYIFHAE